MRTPETDKSNVIAFYEMMFNDCRPADALAQYAGADYIQHNPHVGDGKQAFVDYFDRMAREHPGKRVEVKRAFADDGHVILHCYQYWPNGADYAGIDIFRLDADGKVVEHWDVLQEIPDHSQNDNGMF
ncbi:nuclear transport factor 2 family protein [Pseudooceanicola sp. LIPI14-2-Ac024]|uniref:nuclear transport factor 2 family protein n=1 Tax=Pseudooceanicola sp. LIPI14-2-Ac024 TaxID=3344875 RepID=UPI0035CEB364